MTVQRGAPAPTSFWNLRDKFLRGEDSPRAYLERCLDRIAARDRDVQAFVVRNSESARRCADESTARYRDGQPLSAMDGCPIGVKDIIETRDFPTQMNSPHFEQWHSGRDAACVRALRAAGGVIVGKLHTTEFAIGRSAPTTNPHDVTRTPGGSSSGSAAAAGDGMLPVTLGTQTAGSVLRPASYCGAVGLKPTHGTLSVAGIHPLSRRLDHLGVIAGCLEDAWLTAHTIWAFSGSDEPGKGYRDPHLPAQRKPSRGLVWLRTAGWSELDGATESRFEACIARIKAKGVSVLQAEDDADIACLEELLRDVSAINEAIVRFEIRYPMCIYRERDESLLGERIRALLTAGDTMSAAEHEQALRERAALIEQVCRLAQRFDAFVTLASSGPAPQGLKFTGPRTFLSPWSVIGGPAYSLPLLTVAGLPQGLQVMGAPGDDTTLSAVAHWLREV